MSLKVDAKISNPCVICLDDIPEEGARRLACDHLFHDACIGSWLETAPTCPLCRLVVTNLTPMPHPPEMSLEELQEVPDFEPESSRSIIVQGMRPIDPNLFLQSINQIREFQVDPIQIVFPDLSLDQIHRIELAVRPVFNPINDIMHLEQRRPLSTRIGVFILESPIGALAQRIFNFFH